MSDSEETIEAKQKRLESGRCCWHCRHYIRPEELPMLDGPVTQVCTVERKAVLYDPDGFHPGDKITQPDYYCDRFEFDIPPENHKFF